jgi:AcrR family transcriptional regulator
MDGDAQVDGRRLRREHNRDLVLDALAKLFAEGQYTPTSREIADRAGLSLRSLVRYFDDFDDLIRSAIARAERQALTLVEVDCEPGEPTAVKVRAVAECRVRLFETVAPAARAGRVVAHRQPLVAQEMQRTRRYLRRQLTQLFAPEMARTGPAVLPAMDVLLSFESWELMRGAQRLSRTATVEAMIAALSALVGDEALVT